MLDKLKNAITRDKTRYKPSLCYQLEFEVGGYSLTGVYDDVEVLYYDSTPDRQVPFGYKDGKVVAYILANETYAIVEEDFYEKLKKDTDGFDLSFLVVKSFEEECLCLEDMKEIDCLKEVLDELVWAEDDFLSDETIPFDQEAFEVIDSGGLYLNPKHFAAKRLIEAIEEWQKR